MKKDRNKIYPTDIRRFKVGDKVIDIYHGTVHTIAQVRYPHEGIEKGMGIWHYILDNGHYSDEHWLASYGVGSRILYGKD
jgi:hypothetical protein